MLECCDWGACVVQRGFEESVLTRDMSFQPQRAPKRKNRGGLVILLALVATNIAVVLYHGDPRDHVAKSQVERQTVAQPASKAATSKKGGPSGSSGMVVPGKKKQRDPRSDVIPGVVDPEGTATAPQGDLAALTGIPGSGGNVATSVITTALDPFFGMRAFQAQSRTETITLRRGQMPAHALLAAGVASGDIASAFASLSNVINFRRMRPGDRLNVELTSEGGLLAMDVLMGATEQAHAALTDAGWKAERVVVPIETLVAQVSGDVRSSLWDAIVATDEDPRLVDALVEMFSWDIDFYTEVRSGDTFRLLVEKRFAQGQFVGYGPVLAAEYVAGGVSHRAFAHVTRNGASVAYYDAQGRSMHKQLLKSPLKFARVTSGFGKRRHPILGYTRKHNGVDYGVPTGTPVWSVADGYVVRAGYHGGFGKLVEIRHANGWTSQYAHLSRIHVRVGQRINQKNIIGAVGSTGMSSGPHLHFGLLRHGGYVNPLAQKFSRAVALGGAEREVFLEEVARRTVQLDQIQFAQEVRRTAQKG